MHMRATGVEPYWFHNLRHPSFAKEEVVDKDGVFDDFCSVAMLLAAQQEEEPRAKVTNMLKNMTQRVKVPTMGADQLNSIRRVVHCFPVGSPSNAF